MSAALRVNGDRFAAELETAVGQQLRRLGFSAAPLIMDRLDYVAEYSAILDRFTCELSGPPAAKARQLACRLDAALADLGTPLAPVFADASHLLAELGATRIDPITGRSFSEFALRARDLAEVENALTHFRIC
jgi:hypothetical protein